MIPRAHKTIITVDRARLVDALRRLPRSATTRCGSTSTAVVESGGFQSRMMSTDGHMTAAAFVFPASPTVQIPGGGLRGRRDRRRDGEGSSVIR